MFDPFEMGIEFFEGLMAIDEAIVERAAQEPCRDCGGPLYRGDYPRKPRGGLLAGAAEAFGRRFSLCCGRDGCRHRATPPSVRFLGRRVYVGAVVIVGERRRARGDDGERGRRGRRACRRAPRADGCAGGGARSRRAARSWSSRRAWSPRPSVGDCPFAARAARRQNGPPPSRSSWRGWRRSPRRAARTDRAW